MATGLCGTCGGSMPGCGCYVTAGAGAVITGDGSSGSPFVVTPKNRQQTANPFRNASLAVWQRGTSVTPANGAVAADGFVALNRTDIVYSRQLANDTQGSAYCMRVQRPNGNATTTTTGIHQSVPTADSVRFAGRLSTYSIRVRKSAGYTGAMTGILYTGTGTDQVLGAGFTSQTAAASIAPTLTTSWQTVTVSATPGSSITQIASALTLTWAGTAGTDDYVELKDLRLDEGAYAQEHVPLPYAQDLAECQRFFWRSGGVGAADFVGVGLCTATTTAAVAVPFPAQMRAVPTLAVGGVAAFTVTDGTAGNASSAVALAASTTVHRASVLFTTTGMTVGRCGFVYANSTSGYLDFSAEI